MNAAPLRSLEIKEQRDESSLLLLTLTYFSSLCLPETDANRAFSSSCSLLHRFSSAKLRSGRNSSRNEQFRLWGRNVEVSGVIASLRKWLFFSHIDGNCRVLVNFGSVTAICWIPVAWLDIWSWCGRGGEGFCRKPLGLIYRLDAKSVWCRTTP